MESARVGLLLASFPKSELVISCMLTDVASYIDNRHVYLVVSCWALFVHIIVLYGTI